MSEVAGKFFAGQVGDIESRHPVRELQQKPNALKV
jgi:hypothetical protein